MRPQRGLPKGTSGGECYGTYNPSTETASGTIYINSCIHSGSNSYSGGNTVWYNYVVASAGTITGGNNTNFATESICPKGWTLPTKEQSGANNDAVNFNPVLGGYYDKGTLYYESTRGYWWGSTAYNGARRYRLNYTGDNMSSSYGNRTDSNYIRCVSEEKDVSDLTYMQDMTPSMTTRAAWNLCPKQA